MELICFSIKSLPEIEKHFKLVSLKKSDAYPEEGSSYFVRALLVLEDPSVDLVE